MTGRLCISLQLLCIAPNLTATLCILSFASSLLRTASEQDMLVAMSMDVLVPYLTSTPAKPRIRRPTSAAHADEPKTWSCAQVRQSIPHRGGSRMVLDRLLL